VRSYAKEPGKKPERQRACVLFSAASVDAWAKAVQEAVAERLKFARIWGAARFDGQQVDRDHVLSDRDVVELHV